MRRPFSAKGGFSVQRIYALKEPHAFHYLSQRVTFWIALVSTFGFVVGNMIGQNGWQVFWRSVLGKEDLESRIVYTGTAPPVADIPDCKAWSKYGGNIHLHTYEQVPQTVLRKLPAYEPSGVGMENGNQCITYSIGYMGSYATGKVGEGSHPGIDILVPSNTPVHAVMDGLVVQAKQDAGFGNYVVLKHPRVPDPKNPKLTTTLYSVYAHLSVIGVQENTIVPKGAEIGRSGKTGFATAPHVHFQIDRDVSRLTGTKTPFHPYWPFSNADLAANRMTFTQAINAGLQQAKGYEYTVDAMLYVQANHVSPTSMIARAAAPQPPAMPSSAAVTVAKNASSASPATAIKPVPAQGGALGNVATIEITHTGKFTGRKWETVTVRLLNDSGDTVRSPTLPGDLHLRTAFGRAQFRPPVLTALDFRNGVAKVKMLPVGRTTVVIEIQPAGILSKPITYAKQ